MKTQRVVQDVSALPTYGFGPRMTTTWGTLGFCALEGTGFALAVGAYLYLIRSTTNGRFRPHPQAIGQVRSLPRFCW